MAANPTPIAHELTCTFQDQNNCTVVQCTGRITSSTTDTLKSAVKPLIAPDKSLVLDLSKVTYVDSSGLGSIIGLYVSARTAHCKLTAVNLNARLKELFSLTRMTEVLTKDNDPNCSGIHFSGM